MNCGGGVGGDVNNSPMTPVWHQLCLCPLPLLFLSLPALAILLFGKLVAQAGLSASEWSVISKHYTSLQSRERPRVVPSLSTDITLL